MDRPEFLKRCASWNRNLDPIFGLAEAHGKQVVSDLNKLVYDFAQEHGLTVWQVVEMFRPEVKFGDPVVETKDGECNVTVTAEVRLKMIGEDMYDSGELSGPKGEDAKDLGLA